MLPFLLGPASELQRDGAAAARSEDIEIDGDPWLYYPPRAGGKSQYDANQIAGTPLNGSRVQSRYGFVDDTVPRRLECRRDGRLAGNCGQLLKCIVITHSRYSIQMRCVRFSFSGPLTPIPEWPDSSC